MSNTPNKPWVPEPAEDTGPHEPLSDDMKLVLAAYRSAKPKFEVRGWAALGAKRGMSEATAKQRFGNLKNKYLEEKGEETRGATADTAPAASAPAVGDPASSVTRPARRNVPQAAQSGPGHTNSHHDEDTRCVEDNDIPPPTVKQPRYSPRSIDKSNTTSGTMIDAENNEGGEDNKNPVPAHHRFADPKPYVFPNLGRSIMSSAQTDSEAGPTGSTNKAGDDEYEALRRKYGLPPGWAVPRDDTLQEWIFPGEGSGQAGERVPKGSQDLIDLFAKPPKDENGRTPVPTPELVRRRKEARARLRARKYEDGQGRDDEDQE